MLNQTIYIYLAMGAALTVPVMAQEIPPGEPAVEEAGSAPPPVMTGVPQFQLDPALSTVGAAPAPAASHEDPMDARDRGAAGYLYGGGGLRAAPDQYFAPASPEFGYMGRVGHVAGEASLGYGSDWLRTDLRFSLHTKGNDTSKPGIVGDFQGQAGVGTQGAGGGSGAMGFMFLTPLVGNRGWAGVGAGVGGMATTDIGQGTKGDGEHITGGGGTLQARAGVQVGPILAQGSAYAFLNIPHFYNAASDPALVAGAGEVSAFYRPGAGYYIGVEGGGTAAYVDDGRGNKQVVGSPFGKFVFGWTGLPDDPPVVKASGNR